MRKSRGSRTTRLEAVGQLRLDLSDEVGWVHRLAAARQATLDLRPGVTLESDYRAWSSVLPGRLIVCVRNRRGVVVPAAFAGTSSASVLARLRRSRPGLLKLAAHWTPNRFVIVWFRDAGRTRAVPVGSRMPCMFDAVDQNTRKPLEFAVTVN